MIDVLAATGSTPVDSGAGFLVTGGVVLATVLLMRSMAGRLNRSERRRAEEKARESAAAQQSSVG